MPDKDGVMQCIPCDKDAIGNVMWAMLKAKLDHLRVTSQTLLYRKWCGVVPYIMQGLPMPDRTMSAYQPVAIDEFLRLFRFKSATDDEGKRGTGYTPLFFACLSGNLPAVRHLLKAGADVHCATATGCAQIGFVAGCTPLEAAMLFASDDIDIDELVKVLLEAGADANHRVHNGGTPAHAAVAMSNPACLRALLKHAGSKFNIDQGVKLNDASSLGCAAYMSKPECVALLIEAKANVAHLNGMGGSVLTNAAENPASTPDMLDLILETGQIDVNYACRPRTRKWYLIERAFELAYKHNLVPKTDLVMDVAHTRGSTALHYAARHGHLQLVVWLLQRGAGESLRVRNKLGCTPMDMAHLFGPYPEVEALLGSAMVDLSFDAARATLRVRPSASGDAVQVLNSTHGSSEAGPSAKEKALEQRVAALEAKNCALEAKNCALESENCALRAAGDAAKGWKGLIAAASGAVDSTISELEERVAKLMERNAELEAAKTCIPACVSLCPKVEGVCLTEL